MPTSARCLATASECLREKLEHSPHDARPVSSVSSRCHSRRISSKSRGTLRGHVYRLTRNIFQRHRHGWKGLVISACDLSRS